MNENIVPDEWEGQLIDYTLGVLDPGEAATFATSLEECRRHVQLAHDYGVVSGWMGLAASPAEPPDGHKSRLMSRLHATPQAEVSPATPAQVQASQPSLTLLPPAAPAPIAAEKPAPEADQGRVTDIAEYRARRSGNLVPVLAAVAAVVILLLGLWGWTATSDKNEAESQLAALQAQPNIPSGYKILDLAAQPGYPGVKVSAIYNPQTSDVEFVADGLTQPPSGKVYELWFLRAQGNPQRAGFLLPDQTGTARQPAQSPQALAQFSGFAVSEEPSPGGDAPTGPIIAAGTYSTP